MTDRGRDARLALLAGRQGGAFSRAQAKELGYPSATITHRVRRGTWTRRHPGVYAVGGSDETRTQQLWAAVLAARPGTAITHESAALLHGAERLPLDPITLTGPHGGHHRIASTFVHQIDDLALHHTCRMGGLVVSTPSRVVVELGATQPVAVVGRVVDDFLRMRKATVAQIAAVFAQVARPGKPGVERIARVLDDRSDGYVPPHSELERAFVDALLAGGLPPPVRQLPLPGRGRIRGIADGGYLDATMVLEVDGRRWHDRLAASAEDRRRDLEVTRVGWAPLRFGYELVVGAPAEVCAIVDDTRRERLHFLRGAA